jgi:hypothetical protein
VAKRLARRFTFGRSRVLTPVAPDQVWVFFRGFPTPSHRGMSHITDKAYPGVSINLSVPTTSVWRKRLSGGNEKCILSFRRVCTTIRSQAFSLVKIVKAEERTSERASERSNERTKTFTLFSQFFFSLLTTDYVLSLREVLFVVFFFHNNTAIDPCFLN